MVILEVLGERCAPSLDASDRQSGIQQWPHSLSHPGLGMPFIASQTSTRLQAGAEGQVTAHMTVRQG